jgi:formylglycine-generating enzyme required for sulfatase activity
MGDNPSEFNGDDLPVETVSWNDIQEFIKKLNEKTRRKYRLPTEAEWEYAARGGRKSRGYKYAGSDNMDEVAWYWTNSGRISHPIGKLKPNELGLFDMMGNVWEWCLDWYDSDYYKNSHINNPIGPSNGSYRVNRGGSWNFDAAFDTYPSTRSYQSPDYKDSNLGFRLHWTA